MKIYHFDTVLKRPDRIGTWHYIDSPVQVEKEFNTKGKVRICGKINEEPFDSTLIPRGNGQHYIVLDKAIRGKTKIEIGDNLKVEIWKDLSERKMDIPKDLQTELSEKQSVLIFFENLAYSHQKAFVDWINSEKKEDTKKKRIAKTVLMLYERKKLR